MLIFDPIFKEMLEITHKAGTECDISIRNIRIDSKGKIKVFDI